MLNEEILQFLRELITHNNREWFHDNKKRFDTLWKGFGEEVQQLIERVSLFDKDVAGLEAKDCLFRIYRDIRFSHDKSPYKDHFGACITPHGGRNSDYGCYYLHICPERCVLAGGVWGPDPKLLKMLRRDVFDHFDEFSAIISDPDFKATFGEPDGKELKRVPDGFPVDSPAAEYLKYKYYCVDKEIPDSFLTSEDWMERTAEIFEKMVPFNRFLNYTVDEYLGKD